MSNHFSLRPKILQIYHLIIASIFYPNLQKKRNAIRDVANKTNGNMVMASSLFGNSPQVAMSNYYGGANLTDAKDILEQRKYLRFG